MIILGFSTISVKFTEDINEYAHTHIVVEGQSDKYFSILRVSNL
jgi:hypothetical protein